MIEKAKSHIKEKCMILVQDLFESSENKLSDLIEYRDSALQNFKDNYNAIIDNKNKHGAVDDTDEACVSYSKNVHSILNITKDITLLKTCSSEEIGIGDKVLVLFSDILSADTYRLNTPHDPFLKLNQLNNHNIYVVGEESLKKDLFMENTAKNIVSELLNDMDSVIPTGGPDHIREMALRLFSEMIEKYIAVALDKLSITFFRIRNIDNNEEYLVNKDMLIINTSYNKELVARARDNGPKISDHEYVANLNESINKLIMNAAISAKGLDMLMGQPYDLVANFKELHKLNINSLNILTNENFNI